MRVAGARPTKLAKPSARVWFTSLGLGRTSLSSASKVRQLQGCGISSPVTRSVPDGSCFRNTTRLPRKRPERRIRIVPGVMLLRSLVGLCFCGAPLAFTSSPAYHLGAFTWGWSGQEGKHSSNRVLPVSVLIESRALVHEDDDQNT